MKSPSPEEQGETLTGNRFQSVNPAVIPGPKLKSGFQSESDPTHWQSHNVTLLPRCRSAKGRLPRDYRDDRLLLPGPRSCPESGHSL